MALTHAEMTKVLAEADPMGLIAGGAPDDEYSAEAAEILTLQGVPRLAEITGIFAVSFGDPGACARETARWIVDQMAERESDGPDGATDDSQG